MKEKQKKQESVPRWRRRLAIFLFWTGGCIAFVVLGLIVTIPLRSSLALQYAERAANYIASNNLDQASADLAKAKLLSPGMSNIYLQYGYLFEAKKDFKQAVANFKKAYEKNTQNLAAAFEAGRVLWMQLEDTSAKEWIKKTSSETKNLEVHFHPAPERLLGEIALREKNYDQALSYFKSVEPMDDVAEYFLGILTASFKPKEAKEHFANAQTSGEPENAKKAAEFVAAINSPNYPLSVWGKLAEAGFGEMIVNDAKTYASSHPDSRDGWTTYSFILMSLKRSEEALEAIGKALEIDPIYAYGYELLAQIQEKQGRRELSEEAREKAELFK